MSRRKATLDPGRMTDDALWKAAFGLLARCYFSNGHTPRERDELLFELQRVLAELRARAKQLQLG